MGRFPTLTLIFLFLLLNYASGSSKTKLEKECIVKSQFTHNMQDEASINLAFCIDQENPISFHMSFMDHKPHENNDLLILNPGSGKIQQRRNGERSLEKLTLNTNIPVGWNNITVTWRDNKLELGIFYTMSLFGKEVDEISIGGKYMTDCAKGTPTWEIRESSEVTIPLIGLSSFELVLSSVQPFRPDLILNSLSIPLSYNEQLFLRKSIIALPANDYRIAFLKSSHVLTIFAIDNNEENQLLMKVHTNEDLMELRVKSNYGSFELVFNPFQDDEFVVETTIIKRNNKILEETENVKLSTINAEVDITAQGSYGKGGAQSSTVWQVTTVLFAVIAAGSILINLYQYSRNKKEKYQEFGSMEEGEPLLEKQSKILAKEKIKCEKTESKEEFKPKFNYQREICKLKLECDQISKHKKTLGKLNEDKPTKVLLVVGETGSGKSSTINAMANYIYGITYEDLFRFKLVDDMDSPRSFGINTTEEFTSYYIPCSPGIVNDANYILIDTPGFGDYRGINEDRKLITKFYSFLKNNQDITDVDGICFVMKASDNRLTEIQNYIINGLFSMFGKDIKNNICIILSFSDGSMTHVPKLLKESGLPYYLDIHFNGQCVFNDINGINGSSEKSIQEYFRKNWKMNMKGLESFFRSLKKNNPVSLALTNIALEENKDINHLTDELLKLNAMEKNTGGEEKQTIQSKIEHNQNLLMMKLEEAKKLSGRLEHITCKQNPLLFNDYMDILINMENDEKKREDLKNLKERNSIFQNLVKNNDSKNFSFLNYFAENKVEKRD